MGWERKRGKLAEFNRFLRGGDARRVLARSWATRRRSAACATSSRSTPTRCCRPTRRRSWSARWPTRSTARCTTRRAAGSCAGYGILQPRVGVSLPSAHRSRFAAIHSGHPGVDPYTTAVSDVYQDLYGEGSFTGKGDLRRRRVRAGDPRPLPREHAALARPDRGQLRPRRARHRHRWSTTTIPTRYLTYTRRKHRWIRGDWQLLPLAAPTGCPGPTAPSPTGSRCSRAGRSSTTCGAARSSWPSSLFLVAGWTCCPGSPLRWTLLGLGAIAAPVDRRRCCSRCVRPPLDKSLARLLRGGGPRRGHQRCSRWRSRSPSCPTRPGSRPTRSSARSGGCS